MEAAIVVITSGYLVTMAVIDRRKKEIPILPGILCLIFLVFAQVIKGGDWKHWLPGILVGIILYVISKLSKGSIGEGDAFVYMVTGISMGFVRNLELLIISLFLASFVGSILLITKRVGRKYAIPFVPFTTVAYGMVMML